MLTELWELSFQLLLLVFVAVLTYLGWKSTHVRQTGPVIVDPRRFGHLIRANSPVVRVTATTATITSSGDSSRSESRESNVTEEVGFDEVSTSIEEFTDNIITEATETLDVTEPTLEELEQEAIIRVMDHVEQPSTSATGPRRRNIGWNFDEGTPSAPVEPEPIVTKDSLNVERPMQQLDSSQNIRIKLKYLNDEQKETFGNLEEPIGDFTKRNFTVEIAAEKLVRLVFNGAILQPVTKSLKNCGLFDNCVVHVLIHKKNAQQRPTRERVTNDAGTNSARNLEEITVTRRVPGLGGLNEERRRGQSFRPRENGTFFCYLGMFLVTVTLLACWFCRLQYSSLFSFYSTVGLILMTILFLIMIPLLILIERNDVAIQN
jgi:transmembrane and ubiquitin-like domain-containing protein